MNTAVALINIKLSIRVFTDEDKVLHRVLIW